MIRPDHSNQFTRSGVTSSHSSWKETLPKKTPETKNLIFNQQSLMSWIHKGARHKIKISTLN
jgi:hypothetical protein